MPIKKISIFICDICNKEYNPEDTRVSEYSGDVVSSMRIDGYYKPEDQANINYICKHCSSAIIDVVCQCKKGTT